jgi:hypothetical protein
VLCWELLFGCFDYSYFFGVGENEYLFGVICLCLFVCVNWRETKIRVLTKTHALLHLECLDGCNSGGKFI